MANVPALPRSLQGCRIEDLDGSSGAETLFLKSRDISDEDCEVLAGMLAKNSSARQLFLGYNSFGDAGTKSLCGALAANTSCRLELLGLRHCRLRDGAAEALAELLKVSTTLTDVSTIHLIRCFYFLVSLL